MRSRDLHAFSGARLFDGERTLVGQAVLVKDGKVSAVVPSSSIPKEATRCHEEDCTILPGLIDTHVHFLRWQGPQFLAFGVTTVRDVGNKLNWILDRRSEWKENLWPRILCLGPLLDGPTPFHEVVSRRCADPFDGVRAVEETISAGVDGVKFYVGLSADWVGPMTDKAHALGRKASIHCGICGILDAARAGVDEFYHLDGVLVDLWPNRPPGWLEVWGLPEFSQTLDRQQQVADSIRELGITATPTLAYWDSQWRIRTGRPEEYEDLKHTPPSIIKWQAVPPDPALSEQWKRALHAAQGFVGMLLARGVRVLPGSDVPCGRVSPGLSLWRELSLLAEAGMSPEKVFRAATYDAAEFCGRNELGRLSPGSVADMVFVRGNPLERIPSRPDIVKVVRGGIAYRPEEIFPPDSQAGAVLGDEPWAIQFERYWQSRNPKQ